MKKTLVLVLVGLVLVALALVVGAFFGGGFSSAPTTSATSVADYGGGISIPDPTPVGGESLPPDEGGSRTQLSRLAGLLAWLIVLTAWCAVRLTSKWKWDDYVLYIGSLGCLLLSFTARGCLGDASPMTAGWWVAECLWVIVIIPWVLDEYLKRKWLKRAIFVLGWVLLGVFS